MRCHTIPCNRYQSVGLHTWRATTVLHWIYNTEFPPPALTYAMLMHDVPEVYTGDIPGNVKADWPGLSEVLNTMEANFTAQFELVRGPLSETEEQILHLCDSVDLVLYALDEMEMGNKFFEPIALKALEMAQVPYQRLRDLLPVQLERIEQLVEMLEDRVGVSL